ncbi:MAG: SdpI family protein [Eubacterium sp.]|jgi:hypothetical protein|nr:SdpI family protein [Eubacterium sp.]NBI85990.1 SdpI family protein [Lachnospiraceae bacterium]
MYALLVLNLIVPFVMVLVGVLLKMYPAADMGSHNGYNTPASRKSQEHWDFAQQAAPDIFIRVGKAAGMAAVILNLLFFVFQVPVMAGVAVGNGIGFLFLFAGFIKTDNAVNHKFSSE